MLKGQSMMISFYNFLIDRKKFFQTKLEVLGFLTYTDFKYHGSIVKVHKLYSVHLKTEFLIVYPIFILKLQSKIEEFIKYFKFL